MGGISRAAVRSRRVRLLGRQRRRSSSGAVGARGWTTASRSGEGGAAVSTDPGSLVSMGVPPSLSRVPRGRAALPGRRAWGAPRDCPIRLRCLGRERPPGRVDPRPQKRPGEKCRLAVRSRGVHRSSPAQRPVCPKPPGPRPVAPSASRPSTASHSGVATGLITNWATRSPLRIVTGPRPAFKRSTSISPR